MNEAEGTACEDMMHMLRDLIAKEQSNMNIVKLSAINLVKLKDLYPSIQEQTMIILKELIESLQDVIKA